MEVQQVVQFTTRDPCHKKIDDVINCKVSSDLQSPTKETPRNEETITIVSDKLDPVPQDKCNGEEDIQNSEAEIFHDAHQEECKGENNVPDSQSSENNSIIHSENEQIINVTQETTKSEENNSTERDIVESAPENYLEVKESNIEGTFSLEETNVQTISPVEEIKEPNEYDCVIQEEVKEISCRPKEKKILISDPDSQVPIYLEEVINTFDDATRSFSKSNTADQVFLEKMPIKTNDSSYKSFETTRENKFVFKNCSKYSSSEQGNNSQSYDRNYKQFDEDEELFSSYLSYSSNKQGSVEARQPYNNIHSKSKGIFVGNIDFTIKDYEIIKSFSVFGSLSSFQRPHPGYCFLEYHEAHHGKRAISSVIIVRNRILRIETQKSKKRDSFYHQTQRQQTSREFEPARYNSDHTLNQGGVCKVYISGLDSSTSNSEIARCLQKYGNILDIYKPRPQYNSKCRYVTFTSPNGAKRASDAREIFINNKIARISLKNKPYVYGYPSAVLVCGIPNDTSERWLVNSLSQFGPVEYVDRPYQNSGTCKVKFCNENSAREADLAGFIRFHRKFILIRHAYH